MGPICAAAFLGAFAVVSMYAHGLLAHGAVIAAMIATMGDESFVLLTLLPKQALLVFGILFVLGMAIGTLSDLVARRWIPLKSLHLALGHRELLVDDDVAGGKHLTAGMLR